jgi:hypothetical protein
MPGPVSDTAPLLYWRMRQLANQGHLRAKELHDAADAFDTAVSEFQSVPKVISAWAKARRVWSECTGEPLV